MTTPPSAGLWIEAADRDLLILNRQTALNTRNASLLLALGKADSINDLGDCRYGTGPSSSLVNPRLFVHDTPDLHAYGDAAMPSCPRINPTLAILAIALRAAEKLTHDFGSRP